MAARPLPAHVVEEFRRRYRAGEPAGETAASLGADRSAFHRYLSHDDREAREQSLELLRAGRVNGTAGREAPPAAHHAAPQAAPELPPGGPPRLPLGAHEAPELAVPVTPPGPVLPEPFRQEYAPFAIDGPGACGVLCDPHVPYHDRRTIERWVEDCRRMAAKSLLLNGDVLDFYQLSDYVRDPSKPRMREEILKGRQLLEYLRAAFPKARIVYKEGNHDERLKRYLATRAPDLLDLEEVRLPHLLHAERHGVEWVEDKRLVMVGKLPVIHGHEYRGGGGVMPARWLYLRTGESAMMGHLHQPTFYSFRTMTGREVGMWSVGCACWLSPNFAPLNQWAHGWAMVEVSTGGSFHVHNRRLLRDGSVV